MWDALLVNGKGMEADCSKDVSLLKTESHCLTDSKLCGMFCLFSCLPERPFALAACQ